MIFTTQLYINFDVKSKIIGINETKPTVNFFPWAKEIINKRVLSGVEIQNCEKSLIYDFEDYLIIPDLDVF